ncbi:MAG: hypothetical protein HY541_03775 [Deltaproteobacteria bacterium]|nr:hypothetical protein [Deltaproteobacteria bacterium]
MDPLLSIDPYFSYLADFPSCLDFQRQDCVEINGLDAFETDPNPPLFPDQPPSNSSLSALWTEKSGPSNLIDHYQAGLQLAYNGRREEARTLWENDLQFADTPDKYLFVSENLCWLSLFFKDWDLLADDAYFLLMDDPQSSLGLYTSALVAYRRQDYDEAFYFLAPLEYPNRSVSPLLAWQINQLGLRLAEKTGEPAITPYHEQEWEDAEFLSADQRARYFDYTAYRTVTQADDAGILFGQIVNSSYLSFEQKMQALARSNKPEDFPWLMHLYFRTFFTFRADLTSDRLLDDAFLNREYDCTEYATAICRCLTALGIENRMVAYNCAPGKRHAFVAFNIGGLWGYASPMSYAPPSYSSLQEVIGAWEWDRIGGPFDVGRWNEKTKKFNWDE